MEPVPVQLTILAWVIPMIYLAIMGCSLYAFILFVRLAKRGIKALDIYIDEKSTKGIDEL